MTNPFPAINRVDSIVLDTNVIVNFSRVAPGGLALDYLITDDTTTYVTMRVEQEVRDNLGPLETANYLQWAYRNYTTGDVQLVDTGTPAGRNMGEQSIRELLDSYGSILGRTVVASGDYEEVFPGAESTLDSAALTNSLLLSGEISYVEYSALTARLITIAPHEFTDDVVLIPVPGSNIAYEVNGAIVEIRPNGLLVNGIHVGLNQTFEIDPGTGQVIVTDVSQNILGNDHCFKSDTPIHMWPLDPSIKPLADGSYDEELVQSKVWTKPISEICVGDLVVSYDDEGHIKPGSVTRTMTNTATHLLDFWGTGVTPGHAYYCADGEFKSQHVPLVDILRTDGAIMRSDGTMVRASTNCEVGSIGDMMIHASATMRKPDGSWTARKRGKVRFGTRVILPDGRHISLMEMAASEGWRVSDDGYMISMMKTEDGAFQEQKFLFPYVHGEELPKPEDYILALSNVTLEAIYAAGEWEQIGTRMPAPAEMVDFETSHTNTLLQPSKPEPNIPPAFEDHPDAPRRSQTPAGSLRQLEAVDAGEKSWSNPANA